MSDYVVLRQATKVSPVIFAELRAALIADAKSRQWRDPGKQRTPNYIPESLEAKLQATLNSIPACTRYAAPSTALTLMNEEELAARAIHWRSWSGSRN
jgi:hypothetical protein